MLIKIGKIIKYSLIYKQIRMKRDYRLEESICKTLVSKICTEFLNFHNKKMIQLKNGQKTLTRHLTEENIQITNKNIK
jgi:hypothetical protein